MVSWADEVEEELEEQELKKQQATKQEKPKQEKNPKDEQPKLATSSVTTVNMDQPMQDAVDAMSSHMRDTMQKMWTEASKKRTEPKEGQSGDEMTMAEIRKIMEKTNENVQQLLEESKEQRRIEPPKEQQNADEAATMARILKSMEKTNENVEQLLKESKERRAAEPPTEPPNGDKTSSSMSRILEIVKETNKTMRQMTTEGSREEKVEPAFLKRTIEIMLGELHAVNDRLMSVEKQTVGVKSIAEMASLNEAYRKGRKDANLERGKHDMADLTAKIKMIETNTKAIPGGGVITQKSINGLTTALGKHGQDMGILLAKVEAIEKNAKANDKAGGAIAQSLGAFSAALARNEQDMAVIKTKVQATEANSKAFSGGGAFSQSLNTLASTVKNHVETMQKRAKDLEEEQQATRASLAGMSKTLGQLVKTAKDDPAGDRMTKRLDNFILSHSRVMGELLQNSKDHNDTADQLGKMVQTQVDLTVKLSTDLDCLHEETGIIGREVDFWGSKIQSLGRRVEHMIDSVELVQNSVGSMSREVAPFRGADATQGSGGLDALAEIAKASLRLVPEGPAAGTEAAESYERLEYPDTCVEAAVSSEGQGVGGAGTDAEVPASSKRQSTESSATEAGSPASEMGDGAEGHAADANSAESSEADTVFEDDGVSEDGSWPPRKPAWSSPRAGLLLTSHAAYLP